MAGGSKSPAAADNKRRPVVVAAPASPDGMTASALVARASFSRVEAPGVVVYAHGASWAACLSRGGQGCVHSPRWWPGRDGEALYEAR